jgi:hypothetical protein
MRIILLAFCCLALAAQQAREKIEFCGTGSSHECHCVRRTQAMQEEYLKACRMNASSEKEMDDCMSKLPGHCSLVVRYDVEDDQGDSEAAAAMSERCTMACKKHDCKCDDGPACHIAHSASDHEEAPKHKH